ncbi:MAG: hypothetical protein GX264_07520 [Clostridiales bacterium]|nr:hypothetical protein [Clostridiales bacterium]
MLESLIAFVAFLILSPFVRFMADKQITVRSKKIATFGYSEEVRVQREAEFASAMEKIKSFKALLIIMFVLAVPAAIIFLTDNPLSVKIEYALILLLSVNIAVVDQLVKRIPNELLLSLLAVRTVFIIYSMFSGGKFNSEVFKTLIYSSLVGFALALIIFMLPSLFHVYIGAGDVKFCAVIGYCFGFMGFIEASFVMGLALFIVLIYLRVTKKGSIKSKVALGPYLTLGAIEYMLIGFTTMLSK